MITEFKHLLVGNPIETAAQHDQRLSKRIVPAVFSLDTLSSVAYAREAILFVLVLTGAHALPLVIPITVAIVVLFWWQHLLHNQIALTIKRGLLFRKAVVVISVPYYLENEPTISSQSS